jgi:hypothetical protein
MRRTYPDPNLTGQPLPLATFRAECAHIFLVGSGVIG